MKDRVHLGRLLLSAILALIFWFLPVPAGVQPNGMHLLGIFLGTIVGIITKALPMGGVALFSLTATVLTGTLKFEQAFAGFSNQVVWLVVVAFFLARGFTQTGLGRRIAYLFVGLVGRKTLGLSYGLLATELVLSPAIPSNTARTGGVILPILESLARSFGSDPELGTARRMGAFLTITAFQASCVTSAMFLTGMAGNPLAVAFAGKEGVIISWTSWALAASVPGLLSLIILPFLIYKIYPPSVRETVGAPQLARDKLHEMGKMGRSEWIMLVTFIGLLILWIGGEHWGVTATVAALIGLSVLVLTNVLSWKDILSEHAAWETLFWFSTLIAMAGSLNDLGVIPWVGHQMGHAVAGFHWGWALAVLTLFYFYSHYFFASLVAHTVSMYPVILSVAILAGAPPALAALIFAFTSSLYGCLTHYASGPAALLYGAGFVPIGRWWQIGALMSVVYITLWFVVGPCWWRLLGLW